LYWAARQTQLYSNDIDYMRKHRGLLPGGGKQESWSKPYGFSYMTQKKMLSERKKAQDNYDAKRKKAFFPLRHPKSEDIIKAAEHSAKGHHSPEFRDSQDHETAKLSETIGEFHCGA
jgi:hypothetical protein